LSVRFSSSERRDVVRDLADAAAHRLRRPDVVAEVVELHAEPEIAAAERGRQHQRDPEGELDEVELLHGFPSFFATTTLRGS
jgi:hypothetical protein